jgi:hypothetical protein
MSCMNHCLMDNKYQHGDGAKFWGYATQTEGTVQLKCDGTLWRTRGEAKGKLANGVGSQYSSHYLGKWCIQHYYRWCAHLGCQLSTELTPPADLNGLVRFTERRYLVSVYVPSHFKCSLSKCYALRIFPNVLTASLSCARLHNRWLCSVYSYL